ncbi:MAG TPA: TIGR00366 family protein, partial [Elusimicrobiota bacterium]|nr:TIGR00366 family protein [Elusimicrobiota bacterium]
LKLADARTFPLIVYWYSGVLNYFIPSGGSKWAIEAPYLLQAARALRVSPAATVLAYAWGDMATDLIQPFWCLPLLAVARLEFKDILAYEALAFLVCLILGSAAFYLAF